jgi:NADPH-dependent 2,4-dienoyl-CoA reductase/sulfur reductase-like enzyme
LAFARARFAGNASVLPARELAERAGIAVEDGVLVDEYLATNVPDVFAAGDIGRWHDRYSDRRIRVEHWVVNARVRLPPPITRHGTPGQLSHSRQ